jgi:hypothetical protein
VVAGLSYNLKDLAMIFNDDECKISRDRLESLTDYLSERLGTPVEPSDIMHMKRVKQPKPETCEGAVLPNCTISRTGRVVIVQFDSSEDAESAYDALEKWAAKGKPVVIPVDLIAACRLLLDQLSRDQISVMTEDCDLPDPIAMIQQELQG